MDIIINTFIYTFAILGLIIFLKEIVNIYIYRRSLCRLVLIVDRKEQNIEALLRQVLRLARWSGLVGHIYVLLNAKDNDTKKIAEAFSRENNVNIIEKNELVEILEKSQ